MVAVSFLQVEQRNQTLIIRPLRNIGSFAEDEVFGEWTDLLRRVDLPETHNIVLDFQAIDYFGSTVLEFILQLGRRLKAKHGKLAICNLGAVGKEVLQLARFDKLYALVGTQNEALQAVEQ